MDKEAAITVSMKRPFRRFGSTSVLLTMLPRRRLLHCIERTRRFRMICPKLPVRPYVPVVIDVHVGGAPWLVCSIKSVIGLPRCSAVRAATRKHRQRSQCVIDQFGRELLRKHRSDRSCFANRKNRGLADFDRGLLEMRSLGRARSAPQSRSLRRPRPCRRVSSLGLCRG